MVNYKALQSSLLYDPPYKIVNWVAVAGHAAASSIFLYLYEFSGDRENLEIPYTESYLKWLRIKNQTYGDVTLSNLTQCTKLNPPGRPLTTMNDNDYCVRAETVGVGYGLDLGWLIISFHLLSFFFQALAGATDWCENGLPLEWLGFNNYKYSTMIEDEGKNPLRFIEYSVSASIMLMCIAFLNGVTDINLIASIAVLTACCQLCGLVVEYLEDITLQWTLHFTGWIQFLCAYGIIVHAFLKSISANAEGEGDYRPVRPPPFVYAIVITLFLLYASFGIVQFSELCCKTKKFLCIPNACCDKCPGYCRQNGKISNKYKEILYVSLSLGAKLVLGMLIFTNVLFSTGGV